MNEVGWKSAGITPPGGTGNVVVVEVVEVVEVIEVVDVVDVVEVVEVVELVHVPPTTARAATATPISARARPPRFGHVHKGHIAPPSCCTVGVRRPSTLR
ncbi:MAG: hypothetical protein ABSB54_09750 [Acidimicrobiales bacterium]